METDVIFYKEPIDKENPIDYSVLAVFPNDIFDQQGNPTCYAHIGQHSVISKAYIEEYCIECDSPIQYNDLLSELYSYPGYDNLNILNECEKIRNP